MRRAFTIIELLVIIGIMAAMVTVSVVNVRAGQGAARVRSATRDIFASIRHARSVALVSQQPAIVIYSTAKDGDETVAKVEVVSAKILDTSRDLSDVQTLSGEPLKGEGVELVHIESEVESAREDAPGEAGQTVEDILFAPIAEDVVRGMCIKVTMGDELLEVEQDEAKRKPKISVFSNVDYLIGRYDDAKKKAAAAKAEGGADGDGAAKDAPPAGSDAQEPVKVVWEANGRVEPHRVWVYPEGSEPDKGLCIRIDRFGAAKVLAYGEEDDDE